MRKTKLDKELDELLTKCNQYKFILQFNKNGIGMSNKMWVEAHEQLPILKKRIDEIKNGQGTK